MEEPYVKNKVVKIILGALVISCCLGGGYYMGNRNSTNDIKPVASMKEKKIQKEKLYDTNLIAIVNADEGVKKQGDIVHYSQSLLGTLNIQYEITGIEDAKQGVENGKYSAYMILPGTFSEAVESINHTPKKAVLEYAIAQNLTKDAQAKAIYSVGNAYTTLNNGISELYLYSVLTEVHKVQDVAGTIKENDVRDLKALGEVAGDDLRETIQLPDLATVEKKIDVLDLIPLYEEENRLLAEVDQTYQEAWNNGNQDFNKLRETADNFDVSLKGKGGVNEKYQDMLTEHGSEMIVPEWIDDTQAEKDQFNSGAKDISDELNNLDKFDNIKKDITLKQENAVRKENEINKSYEEIMRSLGQPLQSYEEQTDKGDEFTRYEYDVYSASEVNNYVNNQESVRIDYANQKKQEYYTNLIQSQNFNYLKNEWIKMYQTLSTIDPNTYPVLTSEELNAKVLNLIDQPNYEMVPAEPKINAGLNPIRIDMIKFKNPIEFPDLKELDKVTINKQRINDTVKDIIDVSDIYTKKRVDEINASQDRLKKKDEAVRNSLDKFDTVFAKMNDSKEKLFKEVDTYNPSHYLNTDALNKLQQSLGTNHSSISDKIDNQNKQYESYVEEVYKVSEDNTKKQSESIETAQKASTEKLDSNLANAKSSKQSTYEENQRMLSDMGTVLPYTRLGSQENIMAYRFMTEPLAVNDLTVAKKEEINKQEKVEEVSNTEKEAKKNDFPILVILIPVAVLFVFGIYYLYIRKKRAELNQDRL